MAEDSFHKQKSAHQHKPPPTPQEDAAGVTSPTERMNSSGAILDLPLHTYFVSAQYQYKVIMLHTLHLPAVVSLSAATNETVFSHSFYS